MTHLDVSTIVHKRWLMLQSKDSPINATITVRRWTGGLIKLQVQMFLLLDYWKDDQYLTIRPDATSYAHICTCVDHLHTVAKAAYLQALEGFF